MRKRSNKDIWLNLNEFYLLEEKNKKKAIKSLIKKLNKIKIQEKNITEKYGDIVKEESKNNLDSEE